MLISEIPHGGAVLMLKKKRSCKGQPVLGMVDDPPVLSQDGKRVLVRWGHINDMMDSVELADLATVPTPVPAPPYTGEGTANLAKLYADITPADEILQVYSDPDMRGKWATARYCVDWGVPCDISYGVAPVDHEIALSLGYRTIEVLVQTLQPGVFTLSVVHP